MKIEKVVGIIINTTDYSETSKILNVYTLEYGKIGIISKGCRNLKSKLRSVSDKLTYGYFNIYYKKDGLSTLISVDVINEFINIKQDLQKISYASYLIDLINQVIKENSDQHIFDVLISALIKINNNFDSKIITSIVELKMLEYLGVLPVLDSCVICGSDKDIVTIDGDIGGYICSKCYKDEKIVDNKTIKLLRMFYYVDISKISELNIKEKNVKEINYFLERYYDRYTGLYLKSKYMLNYMDIYK